MMRPAVLAFAAVCALAQPGLEVAVFEEPYGTPLQGARVTATRIRDRFFGTIQPLSCETDAAGRCTFTVGTSGTWQVRVSMPGYLDAEDSMSRIISERIAMTKEGARLRARLVRGAVVEGGVYTEDGKPVAGAILRMRRMTAQGALPSPLVLSAKTGADGRFIVDEIPPGKYGMWIAPPEDVRLDSLRSDPETGETIGYAVKVYHSGVEEMTFVEPVETWAGAQLRNRVIVLRRTRVYPLRGRLIDRETGEPLTAARVALRTADELHEDVFRPRDVNPRTGAFEFPGLAPGEYELLITRIGMTPALPMVMKVEVSGELSEERLCAVPPWLKIAGSIEWPRQRSYVRSRTLVNLIAVEGAAGELTASAGPDGLFELHFLPPGRYKVSVEPEDFHFVEEVLLGSQDVTTEAFDVAGGMGVELLVRLSAGGAEVSGRAVRGRDEPAPRAQVILVPEDERKRKRRDLLFVARTTESGAWSLGVVPPGLYRIFCFDRRMELDPRGPEFWNRHAIEGSRVDVPQRGSLHFDLRLIERSN